MEIFKYNNLFLENKYIKNVGFLTEVVDKLDEFKNYRLIFNYLENQLIEEYPGLQSKYYSKCILLDNKEQLALDAYIFFIENLDEKLTTYYNESQNRQFGSLNHIYRFEAEIFDLTKKYLVDIISQ